MEETHSYHVGIILDGNGRWAKKRMMPRLMGHNAGFKNVRKIVEAAPTCGVNTLTLYAFAIKNWNRDKEEVDGLWNIFRKFFSKEFDYLMELGCQLRMIGARDRIPQDVMEMIEKAEEKSKDNTGTLVQIALNYDGVDEVARMTKRAIESGVAPEEITQEYVEQNLDTDPDRPLDIMIRTGVKPREGKYSLFRNSSFLAVQFSQAIGVSTETFWPDFTPEELKEIIEYADPGSRLFGGQRKEK